jgi:hypothetical protein
MTGTDRPETDDLAAIARKQAGAQAATFSEPVTVDGLEVEEPRWVCPTHRKVITKTSPKGRIFLACPDCGAFE